jgi:hypothetical protein
MIEYTITVKNEHTKVTKSDIFYDPLLVSRDNEMLREWIRPLVERFKVEAGESDPSPDIILKFKMVW